ncbi:unnamed protein product [Euphydryas editha]|uniref:Uncharacterized protein n=1 Tax=Euphydryas editha TaxID=104508 RepID=A0AAU9U226_EUPED|nr:unnamed protein product [Euphydryas editha]
MLLNMFHYLLNFVLFVYCDHAVGACNCYFGFLISAGDMSKKREKCWNTSSWEVDTIVHVSPVLFIVLIMKCQCELTNLYNYNNGKGASQFGNLLRPPPPPLLPIMPVPFRGSGKIRQNNDFGYEYQTPPPPPPPAPPISPAKDFKFPAPFYKQYNFNFVPAPQPFTTTPSPGLFQKVSSWLFPSQQTSSDKESQTNYNYNLAPLKKDCNPCNLVPWIPVIRYDLTSDSIRKNKSPTYGPPSPTAKTHNNLAQNVQQHFDFQNNNGKPVQMSTGVPHTHYGTPTLSYNNNQFGSPSSTYGPPSPTHTITISTQTPLSSPYSDILSHEVPNISIGSDSNSHLPGISTYNGHDFIRQSSPIPYTHPSVNFRNQLSSTTYNPISVSYNPGVLNQHLPTQNNVEEFRETEPGKDLQLPKVTHPTGFKNSYGEPVNSYHLDIPYSVSAAGAASSNINTEILPNTSIKAQGPNMTMALSNPAPFSLNRGRNIHTLQPVALPNLSVSPLPPIFNARPFRTLTTKYPPNIVQGINHLQTGSNRVNTAKSVPVANFVNSIEYPTTFIESPVIDIDELKKVNQSKAYRNIANGYEIDEIRDVSPQASEDHISAAKSNQDSSFENIALSNDLYDAGIPIDFIQSSKIPFNHKISFADLRGVKDEDVDKYRTESNLQYIDSPLLYLKPSAPHKNYKNFVFTQTTPGKENEYEIYDEYPTMSPPPQTTSLSTWETSRTHDIEDFSQPTAEEENKSQPKIVQIIVPYTTGQRIYDDNKFSPSQPDFKNNEQQYQARKIQSNTENRFITIGTEGYSTIITTTEVPTSTTIDHYDTDIPAVQNDFYDVKEPPFDIIKLQHTIDDWTEQEYSKHYSIPHRTRSNEKYAKQIPDEYFTTLSPINNYVTENNNYDFDSYDHEGSSSIQHAVTENRTNPFSIKRKEYNVIERTKTRYDSDKNEESEDNQKLHIYTAASTFRTTTTTTPAPWGLIQTSISPLTNEKVYVVTSKPWRENNVTKEYNYEVEKFVSNKAKSDDDDFSSLDDLSFHSPRFSNRPSYGFTTDSLESTKPNSPYGYSKGWHRRINNLEYSASYEEDSDKEIKVSIFVC